MIPLPPGNVSVGIASGALAAGSTIGFVLERDRQPDPVAGNLAVLDGDVLAGHFGDPDFADCRRGGLDRFGLTGAGEVYAPLVNQALNLIAKATEQLPGRKATGTLSLSSAPTFANKSVTSVETS